MQEEAYLQALVFCCKISYYHTYLPGDILAIHKH